MRSGRRAGARAGHVPLWLSLGLCLLGMAWIARDLAQKAAGRGLAVIDPRCSRLQVGDDWVLPEWHEELGSALARAGRFSACDREAIAAVADEIAALPFVAAVREPEVIWPDGLRIEVRLRSPVACVLDQDSGFYLPVAADGVVLSGRSSTPHRAFGGWLPVLSPAPAHPLPGARLEDERSLGALAVADSLWPALPPRDLERLGRVRIDASRERAPDGLDGGIVIDLEGQRRILFGRAPDRAPLGELPVGWKWEHVSEALRLDQGSWDSYDVRWDEAVAMLRPPELAKASPAGGRDRRAEGAGQPR